MRSLCASCLARAAAVASLSAVVETSDGRLVGDLGRLVGVAGRLDGVGELRPQRQTKMREKNGGGRV